MVSSPASVAVVAGSVAGQVALTGSYVIGLRSGGASGARGLGAKPQRRKRRGEGNVVMSETSTFSSQAQQLPNGENGAPAQGRRLLRRPSTAETERIARACPDRLRPFVGLSIVACRNPPTIVPSGCTRSRRGRRAQL